MTQIDTGDAARFWLGGASQGIGMANSLAQRDLAERQFAFDQERSRFAQGMDQRQMNLAEQRFALDQQEFGRLTEMDRLRAEAENEAKAQRQNTAKTIAQMLRARLAGTRTRKSAAESAAMTWDQVPDLAQMRKQDARGQAPDAGNGAMGNAPRPKPTKINPDPFEYDATQLPLERDYERAITSAEAMGDVEALKYLGESIDDDVKRQADMELGRMALATAENWEFVSPNAPRLKALARTAAYLGKFDTVFKIIENNSADLSQMTPEQFRLSLAGISGGALSEDELDGWTTYFATSRYSPARQKIEEDARRAAAAARAGMMKQQDGQSESDGSPQVGVQMDGPSRRALARSYGDLASKIEANEKSNDKDLKRAAVYREMERAILRGAPVDAKGNVITGIDQRGNMKKESFYTPDGRSGVREGYDQQPLDQGPGSQQQPDRPTYVDPDGVSDLAKMRAEKPEAIVGTFAKQRPNEAARMRELAAQGYSADEIERMIEDEFGLGE